MTQYQDFQLSVCYMLALSLWIAIAILDIQFAIGYIKRKLKKRKEDENVEKPVE